MKMVQRIHMFQWTWKSYSTLYVQEARDVAPTVIVHLEGIGGYTHVVDVVQSVTTEDVVRP